MKCSNINTEVLGQDLNVIVQKAVLAVIKVDRGKNKNNYATTLDNFVDNYNKVYIINCLFLGVVDL